ncbi:ribokinase [Neisseria sicca]|uniref:ribokinase n=1 Tax=Neisseria sicca TaxID=490 RepID=UPI003FA11236
MLHTKVVVVGSINMDLVTRATQFARAGETLLGSSFHRYMGGKGANQAVAAARLGACVTIIGAVGDDDFGLEMVTNLRHEGICTDYVQTIMGQNSGMANITVADEENSIIVIAGANMYLTVADIEAAEERFAEADIILSQLEIPMECVIATSKLAAKYNKTFILNPAPARAIPKELLEQITILTPNRYELAASLGAPQGLSPEELILKSPCPVLMTSGSKGAVYKDPKGRLRHVSGFKVQTSDTTGASDAFNGALAVFWHEGIDIAVRKACAAAALSITRSGAQNGMPFEFELSGFLASQK